MTPYDRHLQGLPDGSILSIAWWVMATCLLFLPGMYGKWRNWNTIQHTGFSWWAWSNYHACKTSLGVSRRVRRVKQAHAEVTQAGLVHSMVNPMDDASEAEMQARHNLASRSAMAELYHYLRRECPALVDDSWQVYLTTGKVPF